MAKPLFNGEDAESAAKGMMISEMARWVDACHNYRHMQGVEGPEPPSFDLAVWMVSTGAAHLRWLIGFDQKRQAK